MSSVLHNLFGHSGSLRAAPVDGAMELCFFIYIHQEPAVETQTHLRHLKTKSYLNIII